MSAPSHFSRNAIVSAFVCLMLIMCVVPLISDDAAALDDPPEIEWANVFGGSGTDQFGDPNGNPIVSTSDGGFVAVGSVAAASVGNGDLAGLTGRGGTDATIVKFDSSGDLVWRNIFGGFGADYFYGVTATSDGGFVAVGSVATTSVGNGDLAGLTRRGDYDATIVKFDSSGDLVWRNIFGGSNVDYFYGVTATSDSGFVAVGCSIAINGDLAGLTVHGGYDGTIAKFDSSGDLVWRNNFGGFGADYFYGVTATSDSGFVAVGSVAAASVGNGDFIGLTGRGGQDATIVKFIETREVNITSTPSSTATFVSESPSWYYTPTADKEGVSWSVSGASFLSESDGVIVVSSAIPTPSGQYQDYSITITATLSGYDNSVQTFTLRVWIDLKFTTSP